MAGSPSSTARITLGSRAGAILLGPYPVRLERDPHAGERGWVVCADDDLDCPHLIASPQISPYRSFPLSKSMTRSQGSEKTRGPDGQASSDEGDQAAEDIPYAEDLILDENLRLIITLLGDSFRAEAGVTLCPGRSGGASSHCG